MNPNDELASSAVAEVTGSSKDSFKINVTLALPTCIAECIVRHHLGNTSFLMSHKIEQQQPNNKSTHLNYHLTPACSDLCSI